ncbi:transposable element Tcb2 transposase [Trichonephila clavipes]|nr:transposable element Tcb2 transposase [Trichonephila clavipes]
MVWGGISIGGRTDLHIIRNGTLTGQRYADEILRPHVIPYAGAIRDSFVFQDDNARPHRARLVENMLEAETIQRMEWPACSPDLNPIEHVWDMLGRRIAARPRPPATVRDLEIALLEEWNSIPQSLIDNFIASMANSAYKPSPCLHNQNEERPIRDWMGLDEWNSWLKSQVRNSNRSQELATDSRSHFQNWRLIPDHISRIGDCVIPDHISRIGDCDSRSYFQNWRLIPDLVTTETAEN